MVFAPSIPPDLMFSPRPYLQLKYLQVSNGTVLSTYEIMILINRQIDLNRMYQIKKQIKQITADTIYSYYIIGSFMIYLSGMHRILNAMHSFLCIRRNNRVYCRSQDISTGINILKSFEILKNNSAKKQPAQILQVYYFQNGFSDVRASFSR